MILDWRNNRTRPCLGYDRHGNLLTSLLTLDTKTGEALLPLCNPDGTRLLTAGCEFVEVRHVYDPPFRFEPIPPDWTNPFQEIRRAIEEGILCAPSCSCCSHTAQP